MATYGFIGTGNMGGAVAKAAAKAVGGGNLFLANRTPAKAEALAAELGGQLPITRPPPARTTSFSGSSRR